MRGYFLFTTALKTNFAGCLVLSHICVSGGHFYSLGRFFIGQYQFCFSFLFLFFFWRSTGVEEAIMLLRMLLFGVFASNYAPFLGPSMLQRGGYAREICYFVVVDASPFPLPPVCLFYFLFPAYFFWP